MVRAERALPRPRELVDRSGPLHFPDALQPGRSARAARRFRASMAAPPKSIRARSGGSSRSTTICSAARRRGSGSTGSSPRSFGLDVRLSARPLIFISTGFRRLLQQPRVSSARAVRALQHRSAGDDRKPARSARPPSRDPRVRLERPGDHRLSAGSGRWTRSIRASPRTCSASAS